MSEYYYINGKMEIYDIEKFKDWLFKELQEQHLVGVFDIDINEVNKSLCEICQEDDLGKNNEHCKVI